MSDNKAILDGVVAGERAKWRPTPGPWRLHDVLRMCVYGANDHPVATCSISTDPNDIKGPTTAERDANARLIAAAPDLLAALRTILGTLDDPTDPSITQDARKASAVARAAIAKAEAAQ